MAWQMLKVDYAEVCSTYVGPRAQLKGSSLFSWWLTGTQEPSQNLQIHLRPILVSLVFLQPKPVMWLSPTSVRSECFLNNNQNLSEFLFLFKVPSYILAHSILPAILWRQKTIFFFIFTWGERGSDWLNEILTVRWLISGKVGTIRKVFSLVV